MKNSETTNFEPISTNNIILAYRNGIFPMAENKDSPDIFWVEPKKRGIIDIKDFSINRKLKKFIKQNTYDVRINTNFKKVIEGCAKIRPKRQTTWINASIIDAYIKLSIVKKCSVNFLETVSPTYLIPRENKTFSNGLFLLSSIPFIIFAAHFFPSFFKGSKFSIFNLYKL